MTSDIGYRLLSALPGMKRQPHSDIHSLASGSWHCSGYNETINRTPEPSVHARWSYNASACRHHYVGSLLVLNSLAHSGKSNSLSCHCCHTALYKDGTMSTRIMKFNRLDKLGNTSRRHRRRWWTRNHQWRRWHDVASEGKDHRWWST